MKHFLPLFFICAIFLLAGGAADALELEAAGGLGNMAFNPESKSSLGAGGQNYEPFVFPAGHIAVKGAYSDLVDFSFRLERDPLLRTRAVGLVGLDFGFGRFEMGPAAGLFNTSEQPLTAGISGGARLEYPGVIFGAVKASSTLASPLAMKGDYIQNDGEIALGFWVPNVICAASINVKQFSLMASDTLFTKDKHIRYQFSADVHRKNVPYTIRVDMGYEELSRSYRPASGGAAETDELKAIYLGFEGAWRVIPPLRLLLGVEMPLYAWTTTPLKKASSKAVFYRAQCGVIWTF